MTYQVKPIEHYLEAAAGIAAINAKYQRQVTKLAQASRRIDFHVDMADAAADQIDEENPKLAKAFERAEQKHLRQEEKYADVMLELEELLPQREVDNVAKQLVANIDAQLGVK